MNRIGKRILCIAICGASLLGIMAQNRKTFRIGGNESASESTVSAAAAMSEEDLDEKEFREMIHSLKPDEKSATLIRKFQEKEGRSRLYNGEFNDKSGCRVETYRQKEVLLVTIPASKLFAPNDTLLRADASKFLAPFKRYLKGDDFYRVLMVMHTDNTGSEAYRDHLTEARSRAVADWYDDQDVDTSYLFPYAFGDDMPLVDNNSITNRESNRRLEVYLMPGKKMLEAAKKGRITY